MADIIGRKSLWGLSHYTYGEAYFGSCRGMRYRVAREPLYQHADSKDSGVEAHLKASVWPEPFSYGKTAPGQISEELFPFSDEGMEQVCNWLNMHLADFEKNRQSA